MGLKKKVQYPELSANEKKLQERAATGTLEEVKALLQEPDVKVDCLDESGMTPLQQAAFRSKYDIAELLIAHGADVNSNMHENGYTALMFAALSGNTDMTRLMLRHGAKKDRINSVKRNAAQMAAFVGQHQCVAVINNYYDKKDLEYYTIPQGQEKEPKLPPMVLPSTLLLLNMSNLHPVKVSFQLQDHEELLNENYKVCKVLDLICEKAMKSRDPDDVMAVKSHYIATVIRKAKDADSLDKWLKRLVKGREQDGYPEFQDQVIRQSLKEFPYIESQLLQNMVRQLSQTKIGDNPTSYNILMQAVNGQKFSFDEDTDCTTCGEPKARKCAKCKMVAYCDQRCQKLSWPTHKKFCARLAEEYKKIQIEKEKEEKRAEAEKKAKEESLVQTSNVHEDGQKVADNSQAVDGESQNVADSQRVAGDCQKVGIESQRGTSSQNDADTSQQVAEEKQTNGVDTQHTEVIDTETTQVTGGITSDGDQLQGDKVSEETATANLQALLSNPAIINAFKDADIDAAMGEIRHDPQSIKKYTDNTKIQQLITEVTQNIKLDSESTSPPSDSTHAPEQPES